MRAYPSVWVWTQTLRATVYSLQCDRHFPAVTSFHLQPHKEGILATPFLDRETERFNNPAEVRGRVRDRAGTLAGNARVRLPTGTRISA